MFRIVLSTATLLVSVTPSAAADEPKVTNRWALLVGVDEYIYVQQLRYCGADQTALRERLIDSGFPADHIFLLHDKASEPKFKPTRGNFERQLNLVLQLAEAEDLVVVAFSGHGVFIDKKSYLCPVDCSLDDPSSLISLDEIYDRLQACAAGFKLVVVDACRNDPRPGGTRSLGATEGTRALARTLQDTKLPEGVVLLNSCGPGEVSWEDEKFGHGVFMHFVLDALGGGADKNNDGAVSLTELESHAGTRTKTHVANSFSAVQRPFFKGDLSSEALEYALLPTKRLSASIAASPPKKFEPFVLAACDHDQYAVTSPDLKGGIFAHFVTAGLNGEADGDGDKEITNVELYEFVRTQTTRHAQQTRALKQVPTLLRGSAADAFALNSVTSKGWAVVVGVDDYAYLNPLTNSCGDAERIAETLVALGIPRNQVVSLNDRAGKQDAGARPLRENFLAKLASVAESASEDDVVFVFFSGHGFQRQGEMYLCPPATDINRLETMVTPNDIYRALEKCKARRQVILLDTCRNEIAP